MSKSVYFMSEAGDCPKALAAARMSYEPVKPNIRSERIMRSGTRHEEWIAKDIAEESGFEISSAGPCMQCALEFGRDVSGFHVELDMPLFRLVGHIDRFVSLGDTKYPMEIKSMGLWAFRKWKKEGMGGNLGYAAQEACYLRASGPKGFYVVRCRDDDETLKYVIGDQFTGFSEMVLPITFDEVLANLTIAEEAVRAGMLPTVEQNDKRCRWCRFPYLCDSRPKEAVIEVKDLEEVAALWREGNQMSSDGEMMVDAAKGMFVSYAQEKKQEKFSAGGVSISYRGKRTKKILTEKKLLEFITQKTLEQCYIESKPWDDIRITVSKK